MALDNLFVHFASSCRCMDTLLTHTLIPTVISEHTVYWFCTIPFGQRYLRLTTYCNFTLLSYSLYPLYLCNLPYSKKKQGVTPKSTQDPRKKTRLEVQKHNKHYTLCVLPKA